MQDQRALLADTVEKLFLDLMSNARHHGAEQSTAVRASLWSAVEENGITALFDPQSEGGFGGGWEDAFVVLSRAGFHAVPLPIAETLLARRLLIEAGMPAPTGPIAVGDANTAVRPERGTAGRWCLNGVVSAVPWGNAVGHVVLALDNGGAAQLALVDSAEIRTGELQHTVAGDPLVDLQFEDSPVIALGQTRERLFDHAALMRTALIAGALECVLMLSVQHASERQQFGRPIGKFQAIQHALALLANETAAVRCAAVTACRAADVGDAEFEIAAAKLRANRAVGVATSIAHQVHGAIGFTQEHALHFSTQRLWSWRSEYGNDRHWERRLGACVARLGAQNLWPYLTARSDR
jgi:acyl-CoA dehydrogenase